MSRTRGDALAAGACALLLITSFLPQAHDYTLSSEGHSWLWHKSALVPLLLVVLVPVVLTVLSLVGRGSETPVGGLRLESWRNVTGVTAFLIALLTVLSDEHAQWGAYLLVVDAAILMVGTAGREHLPVLRGTLAAVPAAADGGAYWFAVPEPRPVYRPDSLTTVAGELLPDTWHLALRPHAGGMLVQTAEGVQALLFDTQGLSRA